MLIISIVSWNNTGQRDVWRAFSHDQSRSSFTIKSGYSTPCQSSSVSLQGKRFLSLSGSLFLHATTFTELCFPFLTFSWNFTYCNCDNSKWDETCGSFVNMLSPPVSAVFLKTSFFINYLAWLPGSTLKLSFTSMKEKTWQQTAWNEVLSDIWPLSSHCCVAFKTKYVLDGC